MTILNKFKEHIRPEILDGICYLTIGGSTAYGTSVNDSDVDLVGIFIPPREYMYPQEYGYINGFTEPPKLIDANTSKDDMTLQVHHVYDENGQEYDINLYHIVKFFTLACNGNPNIIDAINTLPKYHKVADEVGQLIYENRQEFYSKNMYPRFRGMIANHLKTITKPKIGKRAGMVEKWGYDIKDAAHVIRVQYNLLSILLCHTYELQMYSEFIKTIRAGELRYEDVIDIYNVNEMKMEEFISTSNLPDEVNRKRIAQILQQCLDIHYGK